MERLWTWVWGGTTHNAMVSFTTDELRLMAAELKRRGHHSCSAHCSRLVRDTERDVPEFNSVNFYRSIG